jgi:hypothetical protein
MRLDLNNDQAELLRETLEHALSVLRTEIAHADSRAFKEMLHRREHCVEAVLTQLASTN